MNTPMNEFGTVDRSTDRRRGKRLDEIAMALVLVMTGAMWLAPKAMFPEGTWLAGLGVIILGLNAVRRLQGMKVSGFGIIVALVALGAGAGRILGRDLPVIPVLLIVLGLGLAVRAASGAKSEPGRPDAS